MAKGDRSYQREQARVRAKRVLIHYLRTVYTKAGLGWDHDCEVEVEGIVDDIIQAAIEP